MRKDELDEVLGLGHEILVLSFILFQLLAVFLGLQCHHLAYGLLHVLLESLSNLLLRDTEQLHQFFFLSKMPRICCV